MSTTTLFELGCGFEFSTRQKDGKKTAIALIKVPTICNFSKILEQLAQYVRYALHAQMDF